MSSTDLVVILGVLSLVVVWKMSSTTSQRHLTQIPGPPKQLLVGNLNDIPKEKAWIAYMKMSEQYGSDLLGLNVFGRNLIIVNSLEAASDLFDGRSTIYNSRPRLVMLNELIGFGYGMAFLPYGDHWRGTRKAFHQALGPEGPKRRTDIETKGAHRLLRNFLEKPEDFMDHIRHMAAEIIMRLAYGIDVQPKDDPYVDIADSGIRAIEASVSAGSYLVDSFPVLKHIPEWFPGARFQRQAKEWRVFAMAMLEKPYEFFKKHLEEGNVPYCAANVLLERMGRSGQDPEETESIVKATLSSMYAGGADTTVSTVATFILAMVQYPECLKKAQAEVDRVVGPHRLPDMSDKSSLPYIEAIIQECLRWQPVLPVAIPHELTQDDEYRGYFIPKGSLIFANAWSILHDKKAYPNPDTFNPERFLKDGALNPNVRDPGVACFGFGRRICPGRFMAKESLYIIISSLVAVFDFGKAIDPNGVPIVPKGEYTTELLNHPKPFPCNIKPRSKERASQVWATANDL